MGAIRLMLLPILIAGAASVAEAATVVTGRVASGLLDVSSVGPTGTLTPVPHIPSVLDYELVDFMFVHTERVGRSRQEVTYTNLGNLPLSVSTSFDLSHDAVVMKSMKASVDYFVHEFFPSDSGGMGFVRSRIVIRGDRILHETAAPYSRTITDTWVIDPGDTRIYRVTASTQIAVTPLPASLWMALSGFATVGLLGGRRSRHRR